MSAKILVSREVHQRVLDTLEPIHRVCVPAPIPGVYFNGIPVEPRDDAGDAPVYEGEIPEHYRKQFEEIIA